MPRGKKRSISTLAPPTDGEVVQRRSPQKKKKKVVPKLRRDSSKRTVAPPAPEGTPYELDGHTLFWPPVLGEPVKGSELFVDGCHLVVESVAPVFTTADTSPFTSREPRLRLTVKNGRPTSRLRAVSGEAPPREPLTEGEQELLNKARTEANA